MTRSTWSFFVVLTLVATVQAQKPSATTRAGKPSRTTQTSQPASKPAVRASLTTVRLDERQRRRALAFARTHHPELAKLIGRLKKSGTKGAYEKALGELSRTVRRLEPIKRGNPERYEMQVALWKLESEARLLVARQAMKSDADPELESRLRETLRKRATLRRNMLENDIKRSRARIERIESQLESLQNLDAAADRELRRLKRTARIAADRSKRFRSRTVPVKSGAKPGTKTGPGGQGKPGKVNRARSTAKTPTKKLGKTAGARAQQSSKKPRVKSTVKKTVTTKDKSKP